MNRETYWDHYSSSNEDATIEEKCNDVLRWWQSVHPDYEPMQKGINPCNIARFPGPDPKELMEGTDPYYGWQVSARVARIDYAFLHMLPLIEEADLTECLTSPARFIRRYREWYEAGKILK